MRIRESVSKVIGIPIPENKWQQVFNVLSTQGKITQRVEQDLLVIICQKLEELEQNGQTDQKSSL